MPSITNFARHLIERINEAMKKQQEQSDTADSLEALTDAVLDLQTDLKLTASTGASENIADFINQKLHGVHSQMSRQGRVDVFLVNDKTDITRLPFTFKTQAGIDVVLHPAMHHTDSDIENFTKAIDSLVTSYNYYSQAVNETQDSHKCVGG